MQAGICKSSQEASSSSTLITAQTAARSIRGVCWEEFQNDICALLQAELVQYVA